MSHPRQESGFRFGSGNFAGAPSQAPTTPDQKVPGESIAEHGFEVHAGGITGWYADLLDALRSCRRHGGGRVIRCNSGIQHGFI